MLLLLLKFAVRGFSFRFKIEIRLKLFLENEILVRGHTCGFTVLPAEHGTILKGCPSPPSSRISVSSLYRISPWGNVEISAVVSDTMEGSGPLRLFPPV